jgi:4-hydroxybenzoate polyprenyltransferase
MNRKTAEIEPIDKGSLLDGLQGGVAFVLHLPMKDLDTIEAPLGRKIDAQVARTALRPIPAGQVSVGGAIAWMSAQCGVGLLVLLSLPQTAQLVALGAIPLVALYPLMKRVTWWPQFFLGLAFNWGALMGWSAVAGGLALAPLLLYAGGIAWTLGYDTIYAHQDREDDALVGIKSSARRLGARTRPALGAFYAAAVLLFAAAGAQAGLGWPFWIALAAAALQLAWQVRGVDIDQPSDCLAKFRSNRIVGWLVLAGILAGHPT